MINSFNPLAWANGQTSSVTNSSASTPLEGELAKARAVADELVARGANIADEYSDYLSLGFALAEGLGAAGRDIYHDLCRQSPKYCEADCEKKWQECLAKQDGRITIKTFYKMAQDAGVDLSAIARAYPSLPSIPHHSLTQFTATTTSGGNGLKSVDNDNVISNSTVNPIPTSRREGSEGIGGIPAQGKLADEAMGVGFSDTFSDKLNPDDLPPLLRDVMSIESDPEGRDKVILAMLNLLSGVIPSVYGVYDCKRVYSQFYMLIIAPSGADKGVISCCRQLVMPIQSEIRQQLKQEQDAYEQELAKWNALDRKQRAQQPEPKKPHHRSLFISANSSATSVYEDLSNNGEWGVMFETEADTLTQALQQDYGKFSDGLRKAFHHEPISYSRRKDEEHVDIARPRLSVLLTCTPGQIPLLLTPQQTENGMSNRFLFYSLRSHHHWRNVFAPVEMPLEDRFLELGQRYLPIYHELLSRSKKPIQFVLSEEQQQQFNSLFRQMLDEQIALLGEDIDAFVKRIGLVCFRIAMVLTVLRCEEHQPMIDPLSQTLICGVKDFQTAMTIINCLVNHTSHIYSNFLAHDKQPSGSPLNQILPAARQLLEAMPDKFTTADWENKGEELGIPKKTSERYLGQLYSKYHVIDRIQNGHYQKKK